ncbi:hypothetical protein ACFYUK_46200 [Nonomuraea wenchangensis]
MAVPPIQRSLRSVAPGNSWLLDTLLGLLVVCALPLAIITIPNTLSVVARLLPADIDQVGLMRTHGLALPVLMLTVPLAAVALRRVPAAHLMLAGLALVALSDAAGGYAVSELLVGAVRVLRGVGCGLLVPATLVAVWPRTPVLRGLWAGTFSLSLLTAQALALWPLDAVSSWKVTLQPYPLVTGVALGVAAAYLLAWMLLGRPEAPAFEVGERGRLLLCVVLALGIAVVAISTASAGWRAPPVVLLAATAVFGLLALASIGPVESRRAAYVLVAVGVVLLPSAAQVTLVEMGGLGGPGLRGLWIPYGIAGALAIGAAVAVRLFAVGAGRWLAPLGLLSMVVGLCSVRLVVPSVDGMVLAVPFTLLAVGAAVALTATLQEVGIGAAAFGLSLCVAGVLAGFLLGTGVQMALLDGVRSAQELVDKFVGALHWWALIGGFLLVAVIVLAAVLARRPEGDDGGERVLEDVLLVTAPQDDPGRGSEAVDCAGERRKWGDVLAAADGPGRGGGEEPDAGAPEGVRSVPDGRAIAEPEGEPEEGPVPAVPPQAKSPEDDRAP